MASTRAATAAAVGAPDQAEDSGGGRSGLPPPAAEPPKPDALVNARDEDFKPHTWDEARGIIAADRLDLFDRWPSDARRYVAWAEGIRQQYGSVTAFIRQERLKWDHRSATPGSDASAIGAAATDEGQADDPFAQASDYKVLRNDWPYRWEGGITHLCVWMRRRVPVEEQTGRVTGKGAAMIDEFVHRSFISSLGDGGAGKVQWFKNWTALQSVATLEHFHVLVRDVPEEMIDRWTGGDKTMHAA